MRENEASPRAAEQKRLSELAEARLIADNEVAQKRAVELRRQAAERIEFEKQEKQRQLLAQRVQEQLRREVERRNEIEVTRRTTESQRNLELQMLPVGAAVYAASNDQDAYQEPRNQEPHRPHRSRDQDSEALRTNLAVMMRTNFRIYREAIEVVVESIIPIKTSLTRKVMMRLPIKTIVVKSIKQCAPPRLQRKKGRNNIRSRLYLHHRSVDICWCHDFLSRKAAGRSALISGRFGTGEEGRVRVRRKESQRCAGAQTEGP